MRTTLAVLAFLACACVCALKPVANTPQLKHRTTRAVDPDPSFDCHARALALSFAKDLLADKGLQHVHDALRMKECDSVVGDTTVVGDDAFSGEAGEDDDDDDAVFFVAVDGDDSNEGTLNSPFATLERAQLAVRALGSNRPKTTVYCREGTYYLTKTLLFDEYDSGTSSSSPVTWTAYKSEHVVISGGVPLSLDFQRFDGDIFVADLPKPLQFSQLFVADGERLVWAREPNGNAETDLQPDGYALVNGNDHGVFPDPEGEVHIEVDTPLRNSTWFPLFGRDLDPREPGRGYVDFHEGGSGARFVPPHTFWNGSVDAGLNFNATGGVDRFGFNVSGFSVAGWARQQNATGSAPVAHVFHNAFWGNWFFEVATVDEASKSLEFVRGGWQEGRTGGMGDQPFYVEGAWEALDSPGEWWLHVDDRRLFLIPNATVSPNTQTTHMELVAPMLQRLVSVSGADEGRPARHIHFRNLHFMHSATTFMEPYEVPSAGDWSIHRGGALYVENAEDVHIHSCFFDRLGGNALFLSNYAARVQITRNDFSLTGDSAIAVVGQLALSDGVGLDSYPRDTLVSHNHFRGVGVYGKQTSALFQALACRTTFEGNVLYNGPRAGVNINDGFCGGHTIRRNLMFNWVRETQDHGPINTWDRQCYEQDSPTRGVSVYPDWVYISNNMIMNGPTGNRDLGNLFPTVDNDDGSQLYLVTDNVLVYGGAKNYLGNNKIWTGNFLAYPDRWSGDPCLCAWGGAGHRYENNTCVTNNAEPLMLDSTDGMSGCVVDFKNKTISTMLATTGANTYYTPTGDYKLVCEKDTWSLSEMQEEGQELGSVVHKGVPSDWLAHAQSLLSL